MEPHSVVDGKGTVGPSLLYDITSTGCNITWVGPQRYVGGAATLRGWGCNVMLVGLQHCGLGYIMIVNKLVPLGPKCSPVPC